jgi:serine phosphatase RsbU (regulator of sigma subunit)
MAGRERTRIDTAWRWLLAATALVVAFAADVLTGSEMSSSLVYVMAVSVAAWLLGRRAGLLMAVVSGGAWLDAYLISGVPRAAASILGWNVFAEIAIYAAIALALGSLRDQMAVARALADRLTVANRALDREALAVGRLQRDMLPAAPPHVEGYEWSVHYETSTQAGGDYYDFVHLPDGRLGILIADASGHGTPAAVLMAMTRTLLFTLAHDATHPARLLARLSRALDRMLPAGWFVTACYAILDPESGTLEYALAGHEAPFLFRARTRTIERLPAAGGPPLGPFPDLPFASALERLEPGDALILYTDGLTEAGDADGRLLGEAPVREALESAPIGEPAELRSRVLERVRRHRGRAAASDDLTLLVLGRRPADAGEEPEHGSAIGRGVALAPDRVSRAPASRGAA